jgi:hypothetical protein
MYARKWPLPICVLCGFPSLCPQHFFFFFKHCIHCTTLQYKVELGWGLFLKYRSLEISGKQTNMLQINRTSFIVALAYLQPCNCDPQFQEPILNKIIWINNFVKYAKQPFEKTSGCSIICFLLVNRAHHLCSIHILCLRNVCYLTWMQ